MSHNTEPMSHKMEQRQRNDFSAGSSPSDTEPRWPAITALVGAVGVFGILPKCRSFGPQWLPAAIVGVLLVPTLITRLRGHQHTNRVLGMTIAAVETFFLIASLAKLVASLLDAHSGMHILTPVRLLVSAGALWFTNVLVFALWYWQLDAGGPHQRDHASKYASDSFLFPQMTMSSNQLAECGQTRWSPNFVDYLFLAFNSSTALSPADTAVLSRWAKLLMMVQASVSLTVIAVLAARAINTLS